LTVHLLDHYGTWVLEEIRRNDLSLLGNPDWADNWTRGADLLRLEIAEPATMSVWLAQEAVTHERAAGLSLPEGFVFSGIGLSVADLAFFARSPGTASDGPLRTIEVDGLRFSFVARPGMPESPPGGSTGGLVVLPVEKHHRVFYAAGRSIEVMNCGDGFDYVPLTARARRVDPDPARASRPFKQRVLPADWSVRVVRLESDLVVDLPCPTRAAFFLGSGDSFQGPVRLGV
jgi:hypothetical protein